MSILREVWRFLTGGRGTATPAQHRVESRASGTYIGCTEPVCPHCLQRLEKMPARKKKCPSCGEFIYVRTRPADRAKVLVTEVQAAAIEQQWVDRHTEQESARLRSLPGYERARTQLLQSLGREPSEHEVVLELAIGELAVHRAQQNWGLYRCTKQQIAEELRTLGRTEASLAAYLEVCYLDLNDPENLGGMVDPSMLAECPPFRPDDDGLAFGIVLEVEEMRQHLGLTIDQLRGTFLSTATKTHGSLRLPVSPEAAWRRLKRELTGTDE